MASMKFFSENLPSFDKTKRGTEIFVMEGDKRISVYDDYSAYPDSTAQKWQVKVYDRNSGYHYDRVCMHNGIYPTRERALFEVERFRYRADKLIFYVMPNGFKYDKKKIIWGDEPITEYKDFIAADLEEQKKEADKRLYLMTGEKIDHSVYLKQRFSGDYAKELFGIFLNNKISGDFSLLPFAIAFPDTVLYVSGNKAEWDYERDMMDCATEKYDGIVPAFVYNRSDPELSEFGEIGYKCIKGRLFRTA
ncbi:MAG: hypothetical protein ACI4JW_09425 [Oscillospiraceae bacterium]